MSVQFDEQELKTAADELGLTEDKVKDLIKAAADNGVELKEAYKEYVATTENADDVTTAEKANMGGANSTHDTDKKVSSTEEDAEDEDDDEYPEGEGKKAKRSMKEELADVVANLSEEDFIALKDITDARETQSEETTEDNSELMEVVRLQSKQISELTEAVKLSMSAAPANSSETSLKDMLATLPRSQAAGFLTMVNQKENTSPDDASIAARMDAMEQQFKSGASNEPDMYTMFSSTALKSGAKIGGSN